jgi:hypothetical protein
MQDDWLFHTQRARELRESNRVERWWADRAKLRRIPRLLVAVMVDLWPPRGHPGGKRDRDQDKGAQRRRVQADLTKDRARLRPARQVAAAKAEVRANKYGQFADK